MTALPDGARICSRTGLVLSPGRDHGAWRIAKTSYGALRPPPRSVDPAADPASWGRFDTRGGSTLYMAATRECAFAEVLAYHQRQLGERDLLAKDATFLGVDVTELAGMVDREWQDRGYMRPGHLAKGWRTERALYEIALPDHGWWVLLEHPESIAAAEEALADALASVGVGELDVSALRGGNRDATVLLAEWVHGLVLDDGSFAHGIYYESRHATGGAWAFWLRRVNDGYDVAREPVRTLTSMPIDETDPDLIAVARRIDIRVW